MAFGLGKSMTCSFNIGEFSLWLIKPMVFIVVEFLIYFTDGF